MGPGTGSAPCWGPPALEAVAGSGAHSIDIDIDTVAVDIPDKGIRVTIMMDAARLLDRRA